MWQRNKLLEEKNFANIKVHFHMPFFNPHELDAVLFCSLISPMSIQKKVSLDFIWQLFDVNIAATRQCRQTCFILAVWRNSSFIGLFLRWCCSLYFFHHFDFTVFQDTFEYQRDNQVYGFNIFKKVKSWTNKSRLFFLLSKNLRILPLRQSFFG